MEFSLVLPIAILMFVGVVAGLMAGLLGVGGGILIVPVLYFLFQQFGSSAPTAITVAVSTSLATIVFTSLSSVRAHWRRGNVDHALLKRIALFIVLGVLIGAWVVSTVDATLISLAFSLVALFVAYNMLFRTAQMTLRTELPGYPWQATYAAMVGLISATVGIGGGALSVPALSACNYPVQRAVGTSSAVGLLISLPAALALLSAPSAPGDAPLGTFGLVNVLAFACIVPMTMLFAPIGAQLSSRINADLLKKAFAVLLLLTGLRMLWSSF